MDKDLFQQLLREEIGIPDEHILEVIDLGEDTYTVKEQLPDGTSQLRTGFYVTYGPAHLVASDNVPPKVNV